MIIEKLLLLILLLQFKQTSVDVLSKTNESIWKLICQLSTTFTNVRDFCHPFLILSYSNSPHFRLRKCTYSPVFIKIEYTPSCCYHVPGSLKALMKCFPHFLLDEYTFSLLFTELIFNTNKIPKTYAIIHEMEHTLCSWAGQYRNDICLQLN